MEETQQESEVSQSKGRETRHTRKRVENILMWQYCIIIKYERHRVTERERERDGQRQRYGDRHYHDRGIVADE